jgi:uroporphyrinogen decarboxylase
VQGLREEARQMFENTDYAIVANIPCLGPFEGGCILRGHDQFCIDLASDPDMAEAILNKVTEYALGIWESLLDAVGDYVQVVAQGDDLGMQTGPYISPRMYRKFVKPCHRRIYNFIHSKTKAKIFMHSCGSVYDMLPDLIEVGVDILNPVQASAAKMDPSRLKKEFGKDICFWEGGIDVQQVMPFASPETIEAEVKRAIHTLAPGGGYVFAPSHNIQADVSPAQIHTAYQTALRCGGYPLLTGGRAPCES